MFGQVVAKVEPRLPFKVGLQRWRVRLATEHGVLETEHCGSIAAGLIADLKLKTSEIQAGDLVAVKVGSYDPKYSFDSPMQYFVILFKLKPEIEIRPEGHVFTPDVETMG